MGIERLLLPLALMAPVAATGADTSLAGPGAPPAATRQAPVALLVDLSAGRTLYAREAERRILPASMTKAMTTLIAFDLIKAGTLREDAVVTVRPQTAARWAGKGTTLDLRGGEQVTVEQLLRGTATVSANDAAVALAEAGLGSTTAWTEAMNTRAKALGMTGSHFANPSGLPDRGATHVTARDMVRLAQALLVDHPELYRRYIGQRTMDWRGARLSSHDPFAGVVPGADGIKTGHTVEAGFNFLGAVERDGRRLIVVVAGARTEPARAQAARELVEWGYSAWDSRAWLKPGDIVGEVRVQQGERRTIPVTVPRAFRVTVGKGQSPSVAARIVYSGPLVAPIAKGAPVGGLEVTADGGGRYVLPLVAARAVGQAGPFDRMVNGLLGLWS